MTFATRLGILVVLLSAVAVIAWQFDPLGFAPELGEFLAPAAMSRFQAAWGVHLGLYAGGLAGTAAAILRIRRLRGPVPAGCPGP